jgi:hypothetical protein
MSDQLRTMLALGVIVYGTCIGAWFMFVQPRLIELQDVEAAIARNSHGVVMDDTSVQHIASGAQRLRERLSAIEQGNEFGRDTSHLYGVMMALGQDHGVRVLALQPGAAEERIFAQRTGESNAAAGEAVTLTTRRVSMAVVGTYEQLASFLQAVDDMPQFIRPASIAISPRMEGGGGRLVHGNLAWDVLTFRTPKELAVIEGASHGER